MGFEELASELHKSAEVEGKKLTNAAEKNAAKIVEAAQDNADEHVRAAKKEVASQIKQSSAERITSAKLSAKKIVDEARDEAVEAALHDVWKSFKAASLRKGTYQELLNRLVKEGVQELGAKDATVYVRDEDKTLVSGFRTSTLASEYSGGAIIESADGKIRVNKTLDEAFAQRKSNLRKQIYDQLF